MYQSKHPHLQIKLLINQKKPSCEGYNFFSLHFMVTSKTVTERRFISKIYCSKSHPNPYA